MTIDITPEKIWEDIDIRTTDQRIGVGVGDDIIAYRIIEDHEPIAREQITAQIEALQKQLEALPVVKRMWFNGGNNCGLQHPSDKYYFDIETINGVPHIHGVAMKEVIHPPRP